jgi:hypothetical protein
MEKYARMRRMNLPDGAIRQKMASDGLSSDLVALFFSTPAGDSASVPSGPPAAPGQSFCPRITLLLPSFPPSFLIAHL